MKIWNIWPTETEGWVCLRRLAQINTIITCENGHPMTLSLYYFSDSTQWKCSKKSPRSWALDKQGISIYANKGMGMNKSSEHLGCHAVYVRSRKYAHYFLNYFSRQFLETYNFPPMLINDSLWRVFILWSTTDTFTILERATSPMWMARNGHIN